MKFPTYEEMAQNVAEKVLDEIEYEGKTLREWIEIISASEHGTNLAEVGTDCISRQAAINAIDECYCGGEDSCGEPWIYKENAVEAINMIKPLPSAQPKRGKWIKTARWGRVYYCDQCRNYLDFDGVNAGRGSTNFCPNCGADMRGEQDG